MTLRQLRHFKDITYYILYGNKLIFYPSKSSSIKFFHSLIPHFETICYHNNTQCTRTWYPSRQSLGDISLPRAIIIVNKKLLSPPILQVVLLYFRTLLIYRLYRSTYEYMSMICTCTIVIRYGNNLNRTRSRGHVIGPRITV